MSVWRRFAIVPLLFLAFSVLARGAESQPNGAAASGDARPFEDVYTLGSGDKIRVIVFGEQDLSGEFTVDDSGSIALPLIGEIVAKGKSLRGLEAVIKARLKDGYIKDPSVSVQVLNYRPFYIYGEVQMAGTYPFVAGLDVTKAIATAGGYTYRANHHKVYITRAGSDKRQELPAKASTLIFPGDVIMVPERYF